MRRRAQPRKAENTVALPRTERRHIWLDAEFAEDVELGRGVASRFDAEYEVARSTQTVPASELSP
jgi:hypothetical protein